jgi:hypothetical protein
MSNDSQEGKQQPLLRGEPLTLPPTDAPRTRVTASEHGGGKSTTPDDSHSTDQRARSAGWIVGIVALLAVAIGIAAPVLDFIVLADVNVDVGLIAGAGGLAPLTFFGIWFYELRHGGLPNSEAMRDAIAGAFVILYLTTVAWSTFFNVFPKEEQNTLAPLTQTVLTNFSTLTGVVVAFYFGSQAITKGLEKGRRRKD